MRAAARSELPGGEDLGPAVEVGGVAQLGHAEGRLEAGVAPRRGAAQPAARGARSHGEPFRVFMCLAYIHTHDVSAASGSAINLKHFVKAEFHFKQTAKCF